MNKQTSVSNHSDGNNQVVFATVDAAVSAAVDAQIHSWSVAYGFRSPDRHQ